MSFKVITIDGPSGSGKSSSAKALAEKLNFCHINSGMIYRALAYKLLWLKVDIESSIKVTEELLENLGKDLNFENNNNSLVVLFKNKNLDHELYSQKVEKAVAKVSNLIWIRKIAKSIQQRFSQKMNIVIDGRDCGTAVFPNADVKFFLTADLSIRAQRIFNRMLESEPSEMPLLEELIGQVAARDEKDATRSISPLKMAEDAILIDNSNLNKKETIELLLEKIKEKNI